MPNKASPRSAADLRPTSARGPGSCPDGRQLSLYRPVRRDQHHHRQPGRQHQRRRRFRGRARPHPGRPRQFHRHRPDRLRQCHRHHATPGRPAEPRPGRDRHRPVGQPQRDRRDAGDAACRRGPQRHRGDLPVGFRAVRPQRRPALQPALPQTIFARRAKRYAQRRTDRPDQHLRRRLRRRHELRLHRPARRCIERRRHADHGLSGGLGQRA